MIQAAESVFRSNPKFDNVRIIPKLSTSVTKQKDLLDKVTSLFSSRGGFFLVA